MKKLFITIAIAASAYATVQAQGLVVFNNGSGTKVSTNGVSGGPALGVTGATAGSFYYALYMSASATDVGGSTAAAIPGATALGTFVFNAANAGSWTQVALGTNTTAGRFLSSTPDANGNTAIAGLAAGSSAQFLVLGWSANLGSTVSALQAALTAQTQGWLGESVVSGPITAGNGTSIPASATFGSGSPFIQGFTLGETPTVPEPGTLALAALGASSLLMLRRKK